MPHDTNCIMKLDPTNNNDLMPSVGDDLGEEGPNNKYSGTVIRIDGCVYGISNYSKRAHQTLSTYGIILMLAAFVHV